MDYGSLEQMTNEQLVNGFHHDLGLIEETGNRINRALTKLKTLPNVPESVIGRYQGKFQSLIDADNQLRDNMDTIPEITQDSGLQVRLLLPELKAVEKQANDLVIEIRREVREKITEALEMQATPVQPTPVQPTPVQPTPVQPTPVQPTPVQPTPVQPTPVQPTPVQPTQDLVLLNNYSFPILQITVPIKLKSTQELQPQNQLISRFLSNTNFEFQLKYVKSQNNQNNIFLGINMNINPDFLNSVSSKSTFVTLRIYNTSASFSRYHENDKSYVTGQLGQIFRIKNNDINISTNLGCKNMTFKKESFNFQIQAKSDLYTMVSSKPGFFCKPQLTLSYEFFPFEKNLMKTTQINKKQNTLVQPTLIQNLNVISDSKIDSIKKKEFGLEVDAADMVQKSHLLRPESHVLVSTPPLPLIIKPSFFQSPLGIFSLIFIGIGALIRGYVKKKNKKSAI